MVCTAQFQEAPFTFFVIIDIDNYCGIFSWHMAKEKQCLKEEEWFFNTQRCYLDKQQLPLPTPFFLPINIFSFPAYLTSWFMCGYLFFSFSSLLFSSFFTLFFSVLCFSFLQPLLCSQSLALQKSPEKLTFNLRLNFIHFVPSLRQYSILNPQF